MSKRHLLRRYLTALALLLFASAAALGVDGASPGETWRHVPMPDGIQAVPTAVEGPVFADAEGRTLYEWPQHVLRNGYSGEAAGAIACLDTPVTVTAGLMSPYPPGIRLPDAEGRPACSERWMPALAGDNPVPVGEWSVLVRPDGRKQWAYEEQALYTSIRDNTAGDVLGGTRRRRDGDSPAGRRPVGPPPDLPPGFAVRTTFLGRLLTTDKRASVYTPATPDADCDASCLERWVPLAAPLMARERGEWSTRAWAPGMLQWVYRGQPLYTYRLDTHPVSQEGSDEPGWRNVFTQLAPPPPASFRRVDTHAGQVLADTRGHTLYHYQCGEDTTDQLACDHPDDTQVYRLALCGGGDPQQCQRRWPYVPAPSDAPDVGVWRAVSIDPETGHFATLSTPEPLRVWAYRDRPIYTYYLDQQPGDVHGAGTGEWRGKRNGLLAFWLRDDFMGGIE